MYGGINEEVPKAITSLISVGIYLVRNGGLIRYHLMQPTTPEFHLLFIVLIFNYVRHSLGSSRVLLYNSFNSFILIIHLIVVYFYRTLNLGLYLWYISFIVHKFYFIVFIFSRSIFTVCSRTNGFFVLLFLELSSKNNVLFIVTL